MSRWFRHYAGMMRDEKLVAVAIRSKQPVERVVWVWGAILESAAEINDGGRYDVDTGAAAYFLRCDESDLVDIIAGLVSLGRLADGLVARWSDRQFDSDSAKERQRRYRERQKAGDSLQRRQGDVGKDVGDVTPPSRDGQVTPQETDTDTDTKKKEKTLGASAPQTEFFAEFWIAYPRREGSNPRKPAKLIFDRLVARGVDPQRLIDAAKALAVEHPTPTRFVPQATTFLNQERFDDEAPLLTGNEFCAEDWPNTRILVARFKQEHQTDPPRAVNGGKAGYLIPAEWVAISKQQRAANA